MAYQGFHKAPALSKTQAQNMWTGTPFYFLGFYLGGICYMSSDRGTDRKSISFTADRRKEYEDIGFKLGYFYVGRQDQPSPCNAPTSSNAASLGEADAKEAAQFASDVGAPSLSVIYLDVEGGNLHTSAMESYVSAWVSYMNSRTAYWAGIYCSAGSRGTVAQQLFDACGGRANMWVAQWQCDSGKSLNSAGTSCYTTSCTNPATIHNLNLDDTSFSGAYIRQYAGNVYTNYNNDCRYIDIDAARELNPNTKQF
ncbi:glycoside hydrolase domain-containing protein [uncultured Paenibacillus sp.]|uniref:glycoside hydrolase domain-containing protein n=1 Tax=uncultured Paenibacillus sp. TaxID=227322 RepID=UPI0015AFDC63|nr:glycoside hydrolase domain-containing protein [uncultured Paenibacillus sp.]